jgi:DNA-binding transcriptional regulator YiaG
MDRDDVEDVIGDIPLTDSEWAALLCVHVSQVSRWRNGKGVPRQSSAAWKILATLHERIRDGANTIRIGRRTRALLTGNGWAGAVQYACTMQ